MSSFWHEGQKIENQISVILLIFHNFFIASCGFTRDFPADSHLDAEVKSDMYMHTYTQAHTFLSNMTDFHLFSYEGATMSKDAEMEYGAAAIYLRKRGSQHKLPLLTQRQPTL